MSIQSKAKCGFTLVEVMVVVAVIGVLSTIVYPAYAKARETAMRNTCINSLRMISNAKDTYAMDNNNVVPVMAELVTSYIAKSPVCPAGGSYSIGVLDVHAECNVSNHTL